MKADDILRYGTILSDREYTSGRDFYREYTIRLDGIWFLVKRNGTWVRKKLLTDTICCDTIVV